MVPGLHLLDELAASVARATSAAPALEDLLWLRGGRPVEERVLTGLKERVPGVSTEVLSLELDRPGGGARSLPGQVLRLPAAAARAARALRRHRSDVLLGLGGYVSAPAVLGARLARVPVVLLEVNALAGRATRTLAPLARHVVHAWTSTMPAYESPRHVRLGPPLAPAYLGRADDGNARRSLGFAPERPLLLVLGGSQGAGSLNAFLVRHGSLLIEGGLDVLHQVGPGRLAEAAAGMPEKHYRAVEYLDPIADALAAATLTLCRGGAGTLAEVAGRQLPAWVVPYEHGDRHQEKNARELGAGSRVLPEGDLNEDAARVLLRASMDRDLLRSMAAALGDAMPRDGASALAGLLVGLFSC